jgi:hypothetical protein
VSNVSVARQAIDLALRADRRQLLYSQRPGGLGVGQRKFVTNWGAMFNMFECWIKTID